MVEKPYLCKPIITTRAPKWLAICVLIAFSVGLETWLVNRRHAKRGRTMRPQTLLVVNNNSLTTKK